MPVSPARQAAYRILLDVERGRSHSDELLRGHAVSALNASDRNLATALVLGVLRWQIPLDRQIKPLLQRPNARLDSEILIALRLGAFQLLRLDRIPAHAAIDESVELAKRARHRYASGMVNAVLRRIARSEPSEQSAAESPISDAYPPWMVERWTRFYGEQAAASICAHGQVQPKLAVRLADAAVEVELAAAGVALEPGALLAAARIVTSGDLLAAAAFRHNRVRIQDEASQLVAEIAACVPEDTAADGQKILDACAAPGGKTLILAERLAAAKIVACEVNPRRLEQLRRRLSGLAGRVEFRLADAAALQDESAFDLVLADVPCSGTGTLGRNPEIRHRLRPDDLPRQAQRQHAILRAALRAVRPGGRVVYSTCSLEPEENEHVVSALLKQNAFARQVSIAPAIEQLRRRGLLTAAGLSRLAACIAPEGALRLLPGIFATDGFFVAVLEKSPTA